MIPALVILLILSGVDSGGPNLFDTVVLEALRRNVAGIVEDPARAGVVDEALREMTRISREQAEGMKNEVDRIRRAAVSYEIGMYDFLEIVNEQEDKALDQSRAMIAARERIRENTTKKEWKALFKSVSG